MKSGLLYAVSRLVDRVADWFAVVAMIALGVIATVVTLDATARYLFHSPMTGVHAIVEDLLQPAVIFLALPLAARLNAHLRVEIITLRRHPKARALRDSLFAVCTSAFWAVCAWQAGARAWDAYVNKLWPVGEIAVPIVISYGLAAIGCAFAAVAHLFPARTPPTQDNKDDAKLARPEQPDTDACS